jgi:very-long-chain (3R)-3-hydroxyacyl-CoA dehydratase
MASMSKLYLLAYNLACVSGWLYVLVLIALHYQRGHKHETLYAQIHRPLQIVQTAAILEIVHAITGLVRSSAFTTFLQGIVHLMTCFCVTISSVYSAVFSRVGILWGVTYLSPGSQTHWAFTLMVVSWALVEVPRYTFYFAALLGTPPAW